MGELGFGMVVQMVATLTVLAAVDFAYQKWQFEKSIRMTKQEIRDEHRDSEGNPEIKGKIKQKQRMFARRRMMSAVPAATVVIANPTHFCVALKYEMGQQGAPR